MSVNANVIYPNVTYEKESFMEKFSVALKTGDTWEPSSLSWFNQAPHNHLLTHLHPVGWAENWNGKLRQLMDWDKEFNR